MFAAADAFSAKGNPANLINPGPTDTGYMDDAMRAAVVATMPLGHVGTPQDCANLVMFPGSDRGDWITRQLIPDNGSWPQRLTVRIAGLEFPMTGNVTGNQPSCDAHRH